MKDGTRKSFVQAYNAQGAVDGHLQIILTAGVTSAANDRRQLVPLLTQVVANRGAPPVVASADNGYFSTAAVSAADLTANDLHVASDRQQHGAEVSAAPAPAPPDETPVAAIPAKLQTVTGHAVYALRKAIVEPVFGQINDEHGFRRFSFPGHRKVDAEWLLICLAHNLLEGVPGGMDTADSLRRTEEQSPSHPARRTERRSAYPIDIRAAGNTLRLTLHCEHHCDYADMLQVS